MHKIYTYVLGLLNITSIVDGCILQAILEALTQTPLISPEAAAHRVYVQHQSSLSPPSWCSDDDDDEMEEEEEIVPQQCYFSPHNVRYNVQIFLSLLQ